MARRGVPPCTSHRAEGKVVHHTKLQWAVILLMLCIHHLLKRVVNKWLSQLNTHTHIHTQQDGVRDVLPLQPPQDSPSSQFVSLSSSQLEQFELSQQQQQGGSAQGNSVDHSWGTNDKTGGATDFVSVSEMCHSAEASIEHLSRKRPHPDDFSS